MRMLEGSGSKLQPALAGALGERPDATVELVAAAVEDARPDPGLLGALCQQLSRALGLLLGAEPRRSFSVQLTAATVLPASSSISCADRPRFER